MGPLGSVDLHRMDSGVSSKAADDPQVELIMMKISLKWSIKHILWQWGQSTDWQDVMTNLWRKEKLSVIDAMSGDNYSNDENDGNDDNDEN